jgi:transcriptional regulator with XRE-family HTH domain
MIEIDSLLKEKGISKTQLAEMIGISRENLYRALKGNPTVETLKKIATVLNVNIGRLFSDLNGHIEYRGEIYKVTSREDIERILKMLDE